MTAMPMVTMHSDDVAGLALINQVWVVLLLLLNWQISGPHDLFQLGRLSTIIMFLRGLV